MKTSYSAGALVGEAGLASVLKLIACIAVCLGAGLLGSWITRPSLYPWYESLAKPGWTPPNWLFGPVWTILYLMMGVAAWLVWRKNGVREWPMRLFLLQLLLNVTWSALFFGLRSPGAAFVEIVLLWSSILATLIAFSEVAPASRWLLLPYLVWVGYAAALNFSIWRLNS